MVRRLTLLLSVKRLSKPSVEEVQLMLQKVIKS
jgi:hypothetical protein